MEFFQTKEDIKELIRETRESKIVKPCIDRGRALNLERSIFSPGSCQICIKRVQKHVTKMWRLAPAYACFLKLVEKSPEICSEIISLKNLLRIEIEFFCHNFTGLFYDDSKIWL